MATIGWGVTMIAATAGFAAWVFPTLVKFKVKSLMPSAIGGLIVTAWCIAMVIGIIIDRHTQDNWLMWSILLAALGTLTFAISMITFGWLRGNRAKQRSVA